MKNTLLPDFSARAADCVNLRPDSERTLDCLVPVMPPAVLTRRSWRVIGVFTQGDSNVIEFMADGSTLGVTVHKIESAAPDPYIVADGLEGEITGVFQCSEGFVILSSAAMYMVVYDDESSVLRVKQHVKPADFPVIITTIASETTLSMPIAGFKLSGSYSASSVSLEASDTARLSGALYDAYCRASADATASGQFLSPVFSRYRLFDSRGNMLFESVPKLHVATTRHDSSMTTTLGVDLSGARVNAGAMAVPLYKIAVNLPASTGSVAEQQIARLEVQLTPQLHRPDGKLTAVHRLSADGLTAKMPGYESASERFKRQVMHVLANCDSMFDTVISIDNPFLESAPERSITLRSIARSVDEERKITSKTSSACSTALWQSRCRLPHSLTASVGRSDGELTLLANLSVSLFEGHPVEYFTNHGSLLDNVETIATVTFSDGRRVVSHGGIFTYKSMKLSPVIVYPDADAVAIELQLCDSNGNNRYAKYQLRACGRFACYIDENLSTIDMDSHINAAEFHIPVSSMSRVDYPGTIIAFKGNIPGNSVSGHEIGKGDIVAIHPVAGQSSTAWETSRSRYYVMGYGGIYSLKFNKSEMMLPVMLDARPVMRSDAIVTASRSDKSSCVYAIAGRDVVMIDGNSVKTLVSGTEASMLTWIKRHAELLAIVRSGNADKPSKALVFHTLFGGWSTRLLPAADSCFCSPVATRLSSIAENSLYDFDRDICSSARCVYSTELKQHPHHIVRSIPFISEVTIDLTGENIEGTITIEGNHGRRPGRKFSVLYIDGMVNRPIVHHTLMPPRYHVTATVDALFSPDSHLVDSFNTTTHD